MDLPDQRTRRRLEQYGIPAPDEPMNFEPDVCAERIDGVASAVAGQAECLPFAHAYLPLDEWHRLLEVVRCSRVRGMWVQMYSYLDAPRLEALRVNPPDQFLTPG